MRLAFSILAVFTAAQFSFAQTQIIVDSEEYQKLKASGQLNPTEHQVITDRSKVDFSGFPQFKLGTPNPPDVLNLGCFGYQPPDPSSTPTLANNDDNSTGPIALPFNFCFYGTNYTSTFINSNGNISFVFGIPTYTASGFPVFGDRIIAPFWGDVDTRGGGGSLYYYITPTAAYFHWEAVGYYNTHTDKLNTFELVITDGTDPILPPGNNVAFLYDDMNWTTGDASGGSNGFGGTPATVGANAGNGVDFFQIGRFDQAGSAYDGPFGASDGVDWLDNKSFFFDVCNSTNIPPIVAGLDLCDTLYLCVGDSIDFNVSFLSPEAGQTTWDSVWAPGVTNFNIISNTPGNTAVLAARLIGDITNVGYNTINFMAWDNGIPADTINFNVVVEVDSMPFLPFIMGDTTYCAGSTATLSGNLGFDNYTWKDSLYATVGTTPSVNVTAGTYTLIASINGCSSATSPYSVTVLPVPLPNVTGDSIHCTGDSATFYVDSAFAAFQWSNGDTVQFVTDTNGWYSVTVTDTNGCTGISSVFVVNGLADPVPVISGDSLYCPGDSVNLDAGNGYAIYAWSTGDTVQSIYDTAGIYSVTVTDSSGCIGSSAAFTVTQITNISVFIAGDSMHCPGDSVLLTAPFGFDAYQWSNGDTTQSSYDSAGTVTVDVIFSTCSATSAPFTINSHSSPNPVITGNNLYCPGDSVTLSADSGFVSYLWNTSDTSVAINDTAGTYQVTVTDTNGCAWSSPLFMVSESPLPVPSISGDSVYCFNDSTTLSVTGFSGYSWSTGSSSGSITAGVGIHSVTVTDALGCKGSTTINVTNSNPVNSITGIVDFCPGQSIFISALPGFTTYAWSTGDSTQSITASLGYYTVTVTDAYGCEVITTEPVSPVISPDASFTVSPQPNSPPDENVGFFDGSSYPDSIISWSWDLGDGNTSSDQNPVHSYDDEGTYTITLTIVSNHGCISVYTLDYLIRDELEFPNIFTPNGDGFNDKLVFKSLEYYGTSSLTVFNRWGKVVYQNEDYRNDWDGDNQKAGTYYYVLIIPTLTEPRKGELTLIR